MGHRLPFGPLAQQVSPVDRGRPRQDKFALSGNKPRTLAGTGR